MYMQKAEWPLSVLYNIIQYLWIITNSLLTLNLYFHVVVSQSRANCNYIIYFVHYTVIFDKLISLKS